MYCGIILINFGISKDGASIKWEEVRKIYPDKFVKLQVLESHIEGNKRYIDDMAVIKAIEDNREATRELVKLKNDTLSYRKPVNRT